MTDFFMSLGLSYEWALGVGIVAGILLIALPLMLSVAMVIYMDRKVWAAINLRRGPNVVGPFGLLQSFADGLKVFLQETIIPSAANKGIFILAPIVTFTVALLAWAVIPFDAGVVLADINVGLLYILAISSLSVYGITMAGWASNSKYPFFSAMRAAAQMISYEVSIGFILVCVVLYAGTFNLSEIVYAQVGHGFGIVNAYAFNLLLFPMWVVFFISSLAETQRVPFDLTEAESELVAGYQTEYSSMSFALFWLGEYANILLMCSLNTLLFFGGWLPPLNIDLIPWFDIPGFVWFFLKTLFFFFMFSWVMATVPRYRYDQLMRLGWKVFLPMSLGFVVLISGWLMLTRYDCDGVWVQATDVERSGEDLRITIERGTWDGGMCVASDSATARGLIQ
ncbi:MAG: NADH-quinone oxidoreductase subunit NuoH [Alteraurantiacibacter sp.]